MFPISVYESIIKLIFILWSEFIRKFINNLELRGANEVG